MKEHAEKRKKHFHASTTVRTNNKEAFKKVFMKQDHGKNIDPFILHNTRGLFSSGICKENFLEVPCK